MERKKLIHITGIAMFTSTIIYFVIANVLSKEGKPVLNQKDFKTIFMVLLAMSLGVLPVIISFKNKINQEIDNIRQRIRSGDSSLDIADVYTFPNPAYRYQLIIFALCQTPAVLGLIVSILGKSIEPFYPFGGISLLFFVIFWPRTPK